MGRYWLENIWKRTKMKQRKIKIPYSNYRLPPSAEQGGQFVDFNKIIKRKPVKVVKRRKR